MPGDAQMVLCHPPRCPNAIGSPPKSTKTIMGTMEVMAWHGMRCKLNHKHFLIGNACDTCLRGIYVRWRGLEGLRRSPLGTWSAFGLGGPTFEGKGWEVKVAMVIVITFIPTRWNLSRNKKVWGGGTFHMAMGGRVFVDLHQDNKAESCRCGRSNDAGLRLNDDTNK